MLLPPTAHHARVHTVIYHISHTHLSFESTLPQSISIQFPQATIRRSMMGCFGSKKIIRAYGSAYSSSTSSRSSSASRASSWSSTRSALPKNVKSKPIRKNASGKSRSGRGSQRFTLPSHLEFLWKDHIILSANANGPGSFQTSHEDHFYQTFPSVRIYIDTWSDLNRMMVDKGIGAVERTIGQQRALDILRQFFQVYVFENRFNGQRKLMKESGRFRGDLVENKTTDYIAW